MKSVIVSGEKGKLVDSRVEDIPVPEPKDDEVLIEVVVSGTNPKDWKMPVWFGLAHNSGDDIAGYISKVGGNVTEFKKGDRVAAFHVMKAPHGSFAQFAISPAHTTFHVPSSTSFEEAATIPLAGMTAALGLFQSLSLPTPLNPAEKEIPLLIYGGSSAVGAFAIKLAKLANIHPIIAVAGSGGSFASSIGADYIVDYRKGNVVKDIKSILEDKKLKLEYALDAISEGDSFKNVGEVLPNGGKQTVVALEWPDVASHVVCKGTMVGDVHGGSTAEKAFGYAYFRLFSYWLKEGTFTAHPYEVVEGGLEGVQTGLRLLQENKVSAKKILFKIADTPSLSA